MFEIDEIYTVSTFLKLCHKTIENQIPTCWLQGEISNLSRPASGHWYFSLKDATGQIRCALFRLNQRKLKFDPENGMAILVHATPTLYEARGDFQLIIQHIEPVGVGNLNLAFEQLKNQLAEEGLFDATQKKPLPSVVHTIGVVSSSTGAVIQDIIKVLNKRYPFAQVLLFDSVVQGETASEKLVYAIQAADACKRCDVLIIARGGGSLEDLWAFNTEALARAIFHANTPIISAIGHETDTTIADFVADLRAPTPSAAAVAASPDRLELLARSNKLLQQLKQNCQQNVLSKKNQLTQLQLRIPTPSKKIHFFAQKLDFLSANLSHHANNRIQQQHAKLAALHGLLKQHSPIEHVRHAKVLSQLSLNRLNQQIKRTIDEHQGQLNWTNNKLEKTMSDLLKHRKNQLSIWVNSLNHLSPLSTLSRGYSITTNAENNVLSSTSEIKIKQTISTRLADGKIYARVEKIEKT